MCNLSRILVTLFLLYCVNKSVFVWHSLCVYYSTVVTRLLHAAVHMLSDEDLLAAAAAIPLPTSAPPSPPSPSSSRTVRLPSFNKERPKIYFQHIEALFRRHRVLTSYDKYDYLVPAISTDVMDEIQDVIEEVAEGVPDPYERTKERLLLLYAPSRWAMASRILHHPPLGDARPSVLMSRMLALLPSGETPGILFQTAWLERLPSGVRSLVSTHDFANVRAMAAYADRVWENKTAEAAVAALSIHPRAPRSPSPMDTGSRTSSRPSSPPVGGPTRLPPRQRSTLCFYHRKWGMAARYCRDPCSWTGRRPGNAPAAGGL